MIKFIRNKLIVTVLCLLSFSITGQHYFSLSPGVSDQVQVTDEQKAALEYPWSGGMNSCQYNEVDMNLDGVMDLLVFDRHGDRLLPFLNGGTANTVDYVFAPEYIHLFPEMFDWVKFRDYNYDGLPDIFTYAKDYPGIIVYKNTSQTEMTFELEVYPFLSSLQGGGDEVNILTTDVDYPGIADIDNDGDLDILTFWGLGSFVEYHQNQSMELFGIPDSLKYVEVTQCWGFFAESDESNVIYLDTCMGSGSGQDVSPADDNPGSRHTGSTFLLIDLDDDTDKDLLLGDVDYPNLIELINGGDPDSAYMISQDLDFPSYNKPINLFSMPAASYIDVNNNGVNDLLLSPFDPSLVTSANYKSSWLYYNIGSDNLPEFDYVQQNFLQEDMIDVGSGAYPVLEDYDGDGLMDLFVANYGYYIYSFFDPAMILHSVYWSNIALYKNSGSANNPQFTRVTHDFAGLHSLQMTAIFPTFGDLDGDGDKDMIVGRKDGSLVYFENSAGAGEPMEFGDPVFDFQGIGVGNYSTPQLFDLDMDGLLDLAIGEQNGNLNYFRNTGSQQSPQFDFVTDSLGKVNVTDYNLSYSGYSTPCFFKNQEQEVELLVGSEQGKIFYFTEITGNLEGEFIESDSLFFLMGNEEIEFYKGIRTAAFIGNLNSDQNMDMIVGNYSGGIHYYSGADQPPVSGVGDQLDTDGILLSPNPVKRYLGITIKNPKGEAIISVFDIYGNRVMETSISHNTSKVQMDVSDLTPGLYFLRYSNQSQAESESVSRFVKID